MAAVHRTFDVLPTFEPSTSTRTFLVSASDYVLAEITKPPPHRPATRGAPHARRVDALPVQHVVSPIDLLRRDVTIAGTGRGVPGKRASLFSDRFVCVVDAANPLLVDGVLSLEAIRTTRERGRSSAERLRTSTTCSALPISRRAQRSPCRASCRSPSRSRAHRGSAGFPSALRSASSPASLGLVIAQTPIAPGVLVEAAHWHPSKTGDPALQWLVQQLLRKAAELVEFGDEAEATR